MSPKSHKQLHYNVTLVDKVWNLKRECELKMKIHIPLNMVLKDEEYRAELLESALTLNDDNLTRLVWEVREMEDSIRTAHLDEKQLPVKRKGKKNIKLNYLAVIACGLLLFMCGYLVRSLLPIEPGYAFSFQSTHTSRNKLTIQPEKLAFNTSSSLPVRSATPLFRLHGSNTIGEKLAPRLVEAYFMGRGATNIKNEPGQNPVEKTVSGEINGHIEFVEIFAHGSSTAFTDMLNKTTDVGMSSRRIKEQEQALLLDQQGDLTLPSNENVIGLDGLAIIVHTSNGISSLSISQLVKIFSGEITNWSEIGGKNLPIILYSRDEKSGTWDTFKSIVLEPNKAELAASAIRVESSSELSDAVAKDQGAIGFIGLPYVRRAKAVPISATKNSLAILPTHFTIGTEDYPLSRRLYFYISQNNTNPDAEDFVKFSATERGQSIVEDIGLVSQNIKAGLPFDHSFYPGVMRDLTSRSQRLSINFRFKDGSDELDSKSLSDLDRLVKYVESNYPKRLQLFGFSHGEGDKQQNQELSLRRARVVEEQLIARGIYPLIAKGMGEEAPLASSKTESGRRINRRVEVWIL